MSILFKSGALSAAPHLAAALASDAKWINGLLVVAGVLFTLAFAPFDFAYFAPLSLSLLFAAWRNTSPLQAAWRGYCFGLGMFGLGVSWVYVSIHDFGGASMAVAVLMSAVFCAFWAIFPALAGYCAAKCLSANRATVLVPLLWIMVEWVRGGFVLNGFPWLQAAYSQLDTPLVGYVPLFGAYGVGLILALTAWVIAESWHRPMRGALLACAMIWLVGIPLKNMAWTRAAGAPLQVSLLQGNISQDQKWLPENRINTLRLYQRMTEQHWGSQLIIWPETAIPAYLSEVEEFFLKPLAQAAKDHQAAILVSLPEDGEKDDELYNTVMMLGNGQGRYRKNHLLPFGEYMPLQPLSGWVLSQLHLDLGVFTPGGDHQPLLSAAGYDIVTSICYEDVFADAAIAGMPKAAFLVNVTNDAWFGNSIEPHQHLQIARMRALETGRYLLRATNTGATAVVAPTGKVIAQAPLFTETALTATVTPMAGMTPFAYAGDTWVAGILLLVCLGLLCRKR
ncbi:apolipoprotein N-acyltransferase [Methylosoma difficile]